MVLHYFYLIFSAALLGFSTAPSAQAVDFQALRTFKEKAEPYSTMTVEEYRAAVAKKAHPIQELRRNFKQFLESTEAESPTVATAREWGDALRSRIVQQIAIEQVVVSLAVAEAGILSGKSAGESPYERQRRELETLNAKLKELLDATLAGDTARVQTLRQEALRASQLSPPPPAPVCEIAVKAIKILGHLAPQTLQEGLGLEPRETEITLDYLRHGLRGGHVPCGLSLLDHAYTAVNLIWGNRNTTYINLNSRGGSVWVDGSEEKKYADSNLYWNVPGRSKDFDKLSFKDVQTTWAKRWGIKFKPTYAKGIRVG